MDTYLYWGTHIRRPLIRNVIAACVNGQSLALNDELNVVFNDPRQLEMEGQGLANLFNPD